MTDFNPHFCANLDWTEIAAQLDQEGYAVISDLLDASAVAHLIALASSGLGHAEMLGQLEPTLMHALRATFYPYLAPVANRWHEMLEIEQRFPARFEEFNAQRMKSGQSVPQSRVTRLQQHEFEVLHQCPPAAPIFPLQLVVLLSAPHKDFTGGEFVMTEQRPRMQSRPMVVPLRQGDAAIIAVGQRPFQGGKGYYRVNSRHAISRVRSGERIGLELFFDAAT